MGTSEKSAAAFHPHDRPVCPICGPDKVIPDCPYDHPAPTHDGPVGEVPPTGLARALFDADLANGLVSSEQADRWAQFDREGSPWHDQAEAARAYLNRAPDPYQALLTQLHEARAEVARLTPPCDGLCNYDSGPEEDCSQHGRPVREVWEIVATVAAQRDEAKTREAALRAGIEGLAATKPGATGRALRALLDGEVRP